MPKEQESGSHGKAPEVKEKENVFICPMCEVEHAVPGQKSGAELMCPKCVVPMKKKQ